MTDESLSTRYQREKPYLKQALEDWTRNLIGQARRFDSNAEISGRVKSHRSLIGKAFRKPGVTRRWEDFGDLVGLKAIFPTNQGVQDFTNWLLSRKDWKPILDRKEGAPDELKYQANQFDLTDPAITDSEDAPIKVEVQVRTAASDAWYVVDHRLKYKGIVALPEELERKLNRLIVLTELFDEEVEAILMRQAELPEYAAARLYTQLTELFESLFPDQTIASRPEGLFELLLDAYTEDEFENLTEHLTSFFHRNEDNLAAIISEHHHGSGIYVEHRDWIYSEPETLLIAERSSIKPSMLRSVVKNSEFDEIVNQMMNEFESRLPDSTIGTIDIQGA